VEDAIRLAISLGGDADTQATIAGGIAHAWYGDVPVSIVESVRERLPSGFLQVIDDFRQQYQ
jgi:ADP-ribosylglycohydrolase